MTHLDVELRLLKTSIVEMWNLAIDQLTRTYKILEDRDSGLEQEIYQTEKMLDQLELKINTQCENILALFNPVANDLRFVIAVMRINYNIERVGDYANSIAKLKAETPFSQHSISEIEVLKMVDIATVMLKKTLDAFLNEDISKLPEVFDMDNSINLINKNANRIIAELIVQDPQVIFSALNLLTVIHRLERVGDQSKNIAEEIVFYMEAKVLRHHRKN